jgi:hypothetical protein
LVERSLAACPRYTWAEALIFSVILFPPIRS